MLKSFEIETRPEIRKGCVWTVDFKLSSSFVSSHDIRKIHLSPPRDPSAYFLDLRVQSKLTQLVLPFTKAAKIALDKDYMIVNSKGVATLKVRFTARPRALFHKHADVMILDASLLRGSEKLGSDKIELIFRGGTGSIHGAESRQPHAHVHPHAHPHVHGGEKDSSDEEVVAPSSSAPSAQAPPSTSSESTFPLPVDFASAPVPEFEDLDSSAFRDDFLRNQGDTLFYDNPDPLADSRDIWASEGLVSAFPFMDPPPAPSPSLTSSTGIVGEFTLVYGKRRGACSDCDGECAVYRGAEGPCLECGCYPTRHVDLDAPANGRKRVRENDEFASGGPPSKKPRYLLETMFFQRMFFRCLEFLSVEEISKATATSSVPIFVKDDKSRYVYINAAFAHFMMGLVTTGTSKVLNATPDQILSPTEASTVSSHDRFLRENEIGEAHVFDISIKHQSFRVMKQLTTLKDGKQVIVGAVVSNL